MRKLREKQWDYYFQIQNQRLKIGHITNKVGKPYKPKEKEKRNKEKRAHEITITAKNWPHMVGFQNVEKVSKTLDDSLPVSN